MHKYRNTYYSTSIFITFQKLSRAFNFNKKLIKFSYDIFKNKVKVHLSAWLAQLRSLNENDTSLTFGCTKTQITKSGWKNSKFWYYLNFIHLTSNIEIAISQYEMRFKNQRKPTISIVISVTTLRCFPHCVIIIIINIIINFYGFQSQIFPVCYVLMTKRTAECYKRVFRLIEEKVFNLEPSEFITDFEQGMRKAISETYPEVILRGCWYHYCSAISRKMKKLGFSKLLKNNDEANIIKKMLMNLPLLPADEFMTGYKYIKSYVKSSGLRQKFLKFFNYYDGQWIVEVNFIQYTTYILSNVNHHVSFITET